MYMMDLKYSIVIGSISPTYREKLSFFIFPRSIFLARRNTALSLVEQKSFWARLKAGDEGFQRTHWHCCVGVKTIFRDGSNIAHIIFIQKIHKKIINNNISRWVWKNIPKTSPIRLFSGSVCSSFTHHFLTRDGSKGIKRAKAVTLQMMVKFQGSGGLYYMGSWEP